MTPPPELTNLAASVRQRLLNLARAKGREFQHLLSDFAIERFLFRLGASRYADSFVLKGATLLRLWSPQEHRATWDLDLLAKALRSEVIPRIVLEICEVSSSDGLIFAGDAMQVEEIRAHGENLGIRLRLVAFLAGARIPLQIDFGLGDVVQPTPSRQDFPVMLELPAPHILMYPREAVVAEKLDAMLTLGATNSRMKDFYDLYILGTKFEFSGEMLQESIRATLSRRATPIPDETPVALTSAFLEAPARKAQWRSFLTRSRLKSAPASVTDTADLLRLFLLPVLDALREGRELQDRWPAGGPWLRTD